MNSKHVEVLRDLSEVCRAAIKAGDWKVDGACDPDAALRRADAAIASLSAPQPPAEAQPVAWGSLFSECICNGGKAGCPGCNPDKAIELAVAIATHDERRKHPPCMECGAATPKEAETKCICSGDKDDCHGCELWPDPDDSEAPSAAVGVEADAAGEDILTRALNSAYEHGARQAVFPLSDCARQVRETLAQQSAAVDEAMVFRMAVWMAKNDGHDDPHYLIWEGSPPEPWGEVWNRYEDNARAALTAALAAQPGGSDNDR